MRKFFSVCFLVVLSILCAPTFTNKYDAQAGRVVAGNLLSEECNCGVSCITCYDEATWQQCNTLPPNSEADCIQGSAQPDYGSMILIGLAGLYLLKRFI